MRMFGKVAAVGTLAACIVLVRIPVKPSSESNRKHPPIPGESIQGSERSDAGVEIISEVDGFGQIRTGFGAAFPSFLSVRDCESPGLWKMCESRSVLCAGFCKWRWESCSLGFPRPRHFP